MSAKMWNIRQIVVYHSSAIKFHLTKT